MIPELVRRFFISIQDKFKKFAGRQLDTGTGTGAGPYIGPMASVDPGVFVSSRATIDGMARISGNVKILDTARVDEFAYITDNVIVKDEASISGRVFLADNVIVEGRAMLRGSASVVGNSRVGGSVILSGAVQIRGDGVVLFDRDYIYVGPAMSSGRFTTAHIDAKIGVRVNCGCFSGTIQEFADIIEKAHGYKIRANHFNQYKRFLHFICDNFGLLAPEIHYRGPSSVS